MLNPKSSAISPKPRQYRYNPNPQKQANPQGRLTINCKMLIQQLQKKKTINADLQAQNLQIYIQDRIKMEIDIQKKAYSEHVVTNYSVEESRDKFYIYQENYLCSLAEFPLEVLGLEKRINLFYSIAQGVKSLSDKLICHRSLSPSSVSIFRLPGKNFIGKINYFWDATILQDKNDLVKQDSRFTKQINNFSCPELMKRLHSGLAGDIWSLGAILNYILFQTTQNIYIDHNTKRIQIKMPEQIPKWLCDLMISMMNEDPKKRCTINIIMQTIKASLKCIEVLQKIIPVGNKGLESNSKNNKEVKGTRKWSQKIDISSQIEENSLNKKFAVKKMTSTQ